MNDPVLEVLKVTLSEENRERKWPYGLSVGEQLDDDGVFIVIASQEIDTTRWECYNLLVIDGPFGSLYGIEVREGLTEYQESGPGEWFVDGPFKVTTRSTVEYVRESVD